MWISCSAKRRPSKHTFYSNNLLLHSPSASYDLNSPPRFTFTPPPDLNLIDVLVLWIIRNSKQNVNTNSLEWTHSNLHKFKMAANGCNKNTVDFNTLYIQYCFSILPIDYALDLRKLCFLNMQRDNFTPIVQSLYVVNGFPELCQKYCIAVWHSRRPICCKCVWNVFI